MACDLLSLYNPWPRRLWRSPQRLSRSALSFNADVGSFLKGFGAYFREGTENALEALRQLQSETKDLKRVVPRCKLSSQNWWSLGLFGLTIKTSFIALLLSSTWGWIMLQGNRFKILYTNTFILPSKQERNILQKSLIFTLRAKRAKFTVWVDKS